MNHKVDDYGKIYIFITRKEMGEYLKSSSKTVIKVYTFDITKTQR